MRKIYGQSKIDTCPFCSKQCTTENTQGIPVCVSHRDSTLNNLRCVCGKELFINKGKYGVFFTCIDCGNLSYRKVIEINDASANSGYHFNKSIKTNNAESMNSMNISVSKDVRPIVEKKELIIRSDDPDYF